MSDAEWLYLLRREIPMSAELAGELARQLCAQARTVAGVSLDDGAHSLMPPDGGFTVRYQTIANTTIASVEGDLLGPAGVAYPAVLAWRSTTGADPRLTPDRSAADLEFFWMTFPGQELAHQAKLDDGGLLEPGQFSFALDWDVYLLPDVRLQFVAQTVFSTEHVGALDAAINHAISEWNQRESAPVHYRGDAEIASDHTAVTISVDLGSGGLDALAEILRAIDASPAGALVARCHIGNY